LAEDFARLKVFARLILVLIRRALIRAAARDAVPGAILLVDDVRGRVEGDARDATRGPLRPVGEDTRNRARAIIAGRLLEVPFATTITTILNTTGAIFVPSTTFCAADRPATPLLHDAVLGAWLGVAGLRL